MAKAQSLGKALVENSVYLFYTLTNGFQSFKAGGVFGGMQPDTILETTKLDKQFEVLTSMPGCGKVLGLTVMLEADDFSRFASPGNYASYCLAVVLKPKEFPTKRK